MTGDGFVLGHQAKPCYIRRMPAKETTKPLFRSLAFVVLVAGRTAAGFAQPASQPDTVDGAVVRGPRSVEEISLVFTGDEFGDGLPHIRDVLARKAVKASFFFTGRFYRNREFAGGIRGLVADGHYVGAHSDQHLLYADWRNRDSTLVTRAQFEQDVLDNYDEMASFGIARQDAPFFLPAYEWYNEEIAQWTSALGLTLVNYTPGTRSHADYTTPDDERYTSSEEIFESILDHDKSSPGRDVAHGTRHVARGFNGFILLSHVGSAPARTDKFYHHLAPLIDSLRVRGYRFARIDRLLDHEDPGAVYIRTNLIGHLPADSKIAIAFSNEPIEEDFEIVRSDDGSIVLTGRPEPSSAPGWGGFDYYYELEFSDVRDPGAYFIRIGHARSADFEIGQDAYAGLHEELVHFMRQQRCGYNPYLDLVCHQRDGRSFYGPMPDSTFVDATGGWHDAGDQLKYLITGSNATARLMLAYELVDGIPDVLDEAKWGLDWLHRLHPAPDQLIHQVADDRDHIGWKMPDDDNSDYGWGPNSYRPAYFATGSPQGLGEHQSEATGFANLAGRSAAALAMASRIWGGANRIWGEENRPIDAAVQTSPIDPVFAAKSLEAARELYDLGRANEGYQQGNSYGAPYRYSERTWADDMEWAAAELFKVTSDTAYLVQAKHYARLAGHTSWMQHDSTEHYEFYPFVNVGHFALYPHVDTAFQDTLAGYYRNGIERTVARGSTNPFGVGVPFIWCSNNLASALITQILLYERMTGDRSFHRHMLAQRDWLLGRNPWGTSMFTGIPSGGEHPQDVHTSIWALLRENPEGGLVDGPVLQSIYSRLKGIRLYESDEFEHLQNDYVVYHDDIGDYATNEPTMDGTAGAVFWMAFFASDPEVSTR